MKSDYNKVNEIYHNYQISRLFEEKKTNDLKNIAYE